ncbi:hypothetical protein TWF696_003011 [Orbilia brochopaga]|uniref:Uncharacterized protein n=1 Tax=Orbilia brochopaga TaxID=3140254 RepID=A0AAV9U0M0_9PEZI
MHDESLLLYARAYDLVEDHTSISPLSFICLPFDTDEDTTDPSTLIASLTEYLPPCARPYASKERLEVTKDAGILLSQTLSIRNYRDEDEDLYTKWDSLRLDEPLLQFAATKPVSRKNAFGKLDLKRLAVSEISTDDDRDEGLSFPSYAWDRKNEIAEDVAGDRMTVGRKVLVYLRNTVTVPVVEEQETMGRLGELTPPLSPLPCQEVPLSPILLQDIAEAIEPLESDESGSVLSTNVEKILLNEALSESPTTSKFLQEAQQPPPITPSPAKRPFPELRVESPLTPLLIISSPCKRTKLSNTVDNTATPSTAQSPSLPPTAPAKKVAFSDVVEEFLLPPSLDPSDNELGEEEEHGEACGPFARSAMAEFTLDVMEPSAKYFLRKLQQEQLDDSTKSEDSPDGLRVEVPVVEWKRPVPRWVHKNRLADSLKNVLDEEVMQKWEYRRSLDIAGLQWAIVSPNYGHVGLDEAIVPDDEASLFGEVLPETLLETTIEDEDAEFWHHRMDPRDDEELECAEIEPKMDLDNLIERRLLKKSEKPLDPAYHQLSPFDPKNQLASFLALQNRKPQIPPISKESEPILISSDIVTSLASSQPSAPTTRTSTTAERTCNLPPPPDPASSFLISASFLTNRTLYRAIKSLCPTSNFIERDFDPHNAQNMFGYEDHVPDESINEADILVTPLVGIVLTNLQTIRQRTLPGLSSQFSAAAQGTDAEGIRDRIAKVSQRYEKLVVGLSIDIGGDSDTLELGKTDCAIIAGFVGFCEAIGNVQVAILRPGGGSEDKARWIVQTMGLNTHRWKRCGTAVNITETESSWETLLRHAGMNSYAAQAVLTKLRESECSLVDFVTIERESRRAIFEPLVGRRVLERFEEVVGAGWLSTQR